MAWIADRRHNIYSDVPLPGTSEQPDDHLCLKPNPDPFTRLAEFRIAADGMVECTLRVVRLSESKFEALSYAWGPPTPAKIIRLNGQDFEIRRNLWEALNAILSRSTSVPSYLWVDAISIDQKNVQERNRQVKIMKHIFTKAHLVWVWLGHGGSDVHIAVQEMTVHKLYRPDHTALDRLDATAMGALRNLYSQPYWTRMWIVQEFVLAKDMRFLYGNELFTWNDLRSTMLYLDQSAVAIYCQSHEENTVRESYQFIRSSPAFSIYKTRKLRQNWAVFDIIELVLEYHWQDCSDPRDKVFALLGLAAGCEIQADYSLSRKKLLEKMEEICPVVSKTPRYSREHFTKVLAGTLGIKEQLTWWERVHMLGISSILLCSSVMIACAWYIRPS